MSPPTTSVLLADDDDAIRTTTALILEAAGFDVTQAVDGEDALEKLTASRYDVAVVDVRMPKRDGIWVVEHIDPAPPPPKVIMASAYALDHAVRNQLGARVFRYLRKPVPPPELVAAVGEAAGASRTPEP